MYTKPIMTNTIPDFQIYHVISAKNYISRKTHRNTVDCTRSKLLDSLVAVSVVIKIWPLEKFTWLRCTRSSIWVWHFGSEQIIPDSYSIIESFENKCISLDKHDCLCCRFHIKRNLTTYTCPGTRSILLWLSYTCLCVQFYIDFTLKVYIPLSQWFSPSGE